MAYSPVGLISSMDRVLHLVIAKVRNFFSFFFNCLGCSFYCDDRELTFIHVHIKLAGENAQLILHFWF